MVKPNLVVSGRTWAIRGLVAIALGGGVGFGTGAMSVRVLQPPGIPAADSIASDSVRKYRKSASAAVLAADQAAASDSALRAQHRIAGTLVPPLVGMQEGDARHAITQAGFTIGTVLFKSSGESAGTVLSTFPVPGESVQLPATVNLVLSDGHVRKDTTATPPDFDFDFNSSDSSNPQ